MEGKFFLSKAGHEVLIKSITQSLPMYYMNVFLIPISVTDELQKMMNSFWLGSKKDGAKGINWLHLDKLCVDKTNGGLGFQNLEGFNMAMLRKQGWRLISDPNTLVSQLLKDKYYPNADFVKVNLGYCPSYTWRSTWSSRVILAEGLRFKIEDGSNVKVWHDKWLRDVKNPKLETPLMASLEDIRVRNLLIRNNLEWDMEMLDELFNPRDVRVISNIPLSYASGDDKLIWSHTTNGVYLEIQI